MQVWYIIPTNIMGKESVPIRQLCVCRALTLPNSGRLPYVSAKLSDEEQPCRGGEVLLGMNIKASQIGAVVRAISEDACQLQIEAGVCPREFTGQLPAEYTPKPPKKR